MRKQREIRGKARGKRGESEGKHGQKRESSFQEVSGSVCFLKCTLQEGVPEFPLYNIKGKHGEMDADMDADAAPWRYASLSRILQASSF